jgi:hypothetical protein
MQRHLIRVSAACLIFVCGCSDAERKQSPIVGPSTPVPSAPDVPTPKAMPKNPAPERLVDKLRYLDSIAVGLHPTAIATAFLANEDEPEFAGGILGSPAPHANPAMKRLVQLGVDAIPVLISHLDDNRPTKLKVGRQGPVTSKWFAEEYDPRKRVKSNESAADLALDSKNTFGRSFNDDYVVKVGDVCYVLIGQIVNRNLLAVRYQPSGCMVVNSPIESPDLAIRVKRDWDGLTKQEHVASLTFDLENSDGAWDGKPALTRLRYYYPATLANLRQGRLKEKIEEMEAASRE